MGGLKVAAGQIRVSVIWRSRVDPESTQSTLGVYKGSSAPPRGDFRDQRLSPTLHATTLRSTLLLTPITRLSSSLTVPSNDQIC